MRNNLFYILIFFLFQNLISLNAYSAEVFNFEVTEVEIIENGNKFIGKKGGKATSEDGTVIKAKNFEYDKIKNILIAVGKVEINNKKENTIIYSEKIIYFKNNELIFTEGKSKAINEGIIINADNFKYNKIDNVINANGNVKIDNKDENYLIYSDNATYLKNEELFLTNGKSKAINEGIIINADNFKYNKIDNVINANGNVKVNDTINNHLILTNDATYYKNSEKITTTGKTKAIIDSRYYIDSKNVTYLFSQKTLTSKHKTKIKDHDSARVYFAKKFNYSINQEIIKGEEVLIVTNYNLPKSDKFFLDSAIINLKNNKFIAKETEIELHKDIFDNKDNDPRIIGVSSSGDETYTLVNKGIFTSCKKNNSCPPWSVKANKIKHDRLKKELVYDSSFIRIYDIPVFYLPKFYHPDPSVKRRSGVLKPTINSSNVLGSSFTLPYFKVISENKDLTLTPTLFDTDTVMLGLEYRQDNKNSNLLIDTNFVNNYKSYTTKKKNTLTHLFLNFDSNLNFEGYDSSDLTLSYENVSNDTYLKVFDQYITKSEVRPGNFNKLNNHIKISLTHEKFNFSSGIESFEDLQIKNKSDRYSYNLPYYNFDRSIEQNYFDGNVSFNSSGNNILSNTNNLKTNIVNNLTYNSLDYISDLGLKNNFGIHFKNLNSVGKKISNYKSSPQVELLSLYNLDVSLPLIKENNKTKNFLTPKLSFRFNPSDMKNYSSSSNIIDANNIFSINRFGLSDSYESGRSLTLGLDYINEKKGNLDQINNYFEAKLATVVRDKEEKFIPNQSSLHRTGSNLFGSISNKYADNLTVGYNFSLDNDFNTLEYNNINTKFSFKKIDTSLNFIETNGERGDTNLFDIAIDYNLNGKNSLQFKTRRNRKINFTEFYDLVYQYKNDCLTAGLKYKKSYYTDGDLKPSENLFFTITLFPLTTYEHDAIDLIKDEDSFLNNLELSEEMFK